MRQLLGAGECLVAVAATSEEKFADFVVVAAALALELASDLASLLILAAKAQQLQIRRGWCEQSLALIVVARLEEPELKLPEMASAVPFHVEG